VGFIDHDIIESFAAERINLPSDTAASPSIPHLARRSDDTVGAIAGYRARWRPPEGTGRWEWVVGRPMADPRATDEREQLIGRVMAVVVDDARTQLRTKESDDPPAWSIRLLQERAARGECRIDPARNGGPPRASPSVPQGNGPRRRR